MSQDSTELALQLEARLAAAQQLHWQRYPKEKFRFKLGVSTFAGWSMPLPPDYTGIERTLYLYIPVSFPVNPPRAAVLPSPYQQWPHAEINGLLCLWPPGVVPEGPTLSTLLDDFWDRLHRVLAFGLAASDAERQEEFAAEWLNYWQPSGAREHVVHLVDRPDPSAPIATLHSRTLFQPGTPHPTVMRGERNRPWRGYTLYATDPESLKDWGVDMVEASPPSAARAHSELDLLIQLPKLPPHGMPTGLPALERWLSAHGPNDAVESVRKALKNAASTDQPISLIFSAAKATIHFGIRCQARPGKRQRPTGYNNQKTRAGSRQQRLQRPQWQLTALNVRRADPNWMIDRDYELDAAIRRSKHVVCVGAGMLGSPVADQLVRSGVGRITLVDPDDLHAANVGRHVLGARALGANKASALAHHLKACVPHVNIVGIASDVTEERVANRWENDADLIVCTAADTRAERYLMANRQREGQPPALMLAWCEPHAVAGHCLLAVSHEETLETFFTDSGEPRLKCADWPSGIPQRQEAGCLAAYGPAGVAGVTMMAAMITEQVLKYLHGECPTGRYTYHCRGQDEIIRVGGAPITPLGAMTSPGERTVSLTEANEWI